MGEEIFNGLITFESNEKFKTFFDTIDKETSIKVIELSIEYGLNNGLFNLNESYCLYKCLEKIKENE